MAHAQEPRGAPVEGAHDIPAEPRADRRGDAGNKLPVEPGCPRRCLFAVRDRRLGADPETVAAPAEVLGHALLGPAASR